MVAKCHVSVGLGSCPHWQSVERGASAGSLGLGLLRLEEGDLAGVRRTFAATFGGADHR